MCNWKNKCIFSLLIPYYLIQFRNLLLNNPNEVIKYLDKINGILFHIFWNHLVKTQFGRYIYILNLVYLSLKLKM